MTRLERGIHLLIGVRHRPRRWEQGKREANTGDRPFAISDEPNTARTLLPNIPWALFRDLQSGIFLGPELNPETFFYSRLGFYGFCDLLGKPNMPLSRRVNGELMSLLAMKLQLSGGKKDVYLLIYYALLFASHE